MAVSAPLARYVPLQRFVAYLEFDGLDAHADAWHTSAAYKLLNDTKLGALLEDLALQGIEVYPGDGPAEESYQRVPMPSVASNTSPAMDLSWRYRASRRTIPRSSRCSAMATGRSSNGCSKIAGAARGARGRRKSRARPAPIQQAGRTLTGSAPTASGWSRRVI